MGRRKGSKNKKKNGGIDDKILREKVIDRSSIDTSSTGISILDLTEEIKERITPVLIYDINSSRTKGIEKRITSLITRHKSFYLQTNVTVEHSNYFVDSGGWAFAGSDNVYNILIGHIKNVLPFLNGPLPLWQERRSYQRHQVRRGIRLG